MKHSGFYCILWLAAGLMAGCGAKPDSAPSVGASNTSDFPADAPFVEESPEMAAEEGDPLIAEPTLGPVATEAMPSSENLPGTEPPDLAFPAPAPESPPDREIRPRTAVKASGADATKSVERYVETEDGRHLVDVFYATDRAPLFQIGPAPYSPAALMAAALAGVVFAALALLAVSYRRIKTAIAVVLSGVMVCGLWLRRDRIEIPVPETALLKFGDWYGADRHEFQGNSVTELGLCQVSLPSDHRVGQLETRSIFRLELYDDPQKHVVIERLERLDNDMFYASLAEHIASSPREEAILFIHGYNVGFSDAVRRTAQMAYDLRFPGAAICYTWPSQGGMESYKVDEANVGWTVIHLEEFLQTLCEQSGVKRLHLIAHSMGNRALTQALERIALRNAPLREQIGQVILAAPDVDSGEFRQRYAPAMRKVAEHVTLYASTHDRALLLSASIHGYERAGLSGEHLRLFPGIDTVDASPIDTSVIGHSYYGDNPIMIRDLRSLIGEGLPAENRRWLKKVSRDADLQFWTFRSKNDPLMILDDAME